MDKIKEATKIELAKSAIKAAKYSYAPYSGFNVGAALLSTDGTVFCGCNIENAAFTPSSCAERTALTKAVSEGFCSFVAIAIVGGKNMDFAEFCPPCGVCRQALAEFCDKDFVVLLADKNLNIKQYTLGDLLPEAFVEF